MIIKFSIFLSLFKLYKENITESSINPVQFYVPDSRCTIKYVVPLNISTRADRATRILILLSDGTTFVINK